MVGTSYNC